jgi:hypothetical protein
MAHCRMNAQYQGSKPHGIVERTLKFGLYASFGHTAQHTACQNAACIHYCSYHWEFDLFLIGFRLLAISHNLPFYSSSLMMPP